MNSQKDFAKYDVNIQGAFHNSDLSRPDTPCPTYFEYCESRMPCGQSA